ncbi:hypothetical protein QCA50_019546 [Cerrena zonata]|uniref:Uncharacterized protein n=1 Tax=Cerrena zonata TaxID=2478898 RepID=A0AAW0FIJ3_9APHY
MTTLSPIQLLEALHYMKTHYNASLMDVVVFAVTLNDNPKNIFTEILQTLLDNEVCGPGAIEWLFQTVRESYTSQLDALAAKASGWHFSAVRAKARDIEDLDIEPMLLEMQQVTPDLCTLVGDLLSADRVLATYCEKRAVTQEKKAKKWKRNSVPQSAHELAALIIATKDHPSTEAGLDDGLWQNFDDLPPLHSIEEGTPMDSDEDLWGQLPDISVANLGRDDEEIYWRQDFESHIPNTITGPTQVLSRRQHSQPIHGSSVCWSLSAIKYCSGQQNLLLDS